MNDGIFNIFSLSQQLENKNIIENDKNNKCLGCTMCHYQQIQNLLNFKSSFLVPNLLNYDFQGENTERTKRNYVEQFNAIINNVVPNIKAKQN